MRYVTFYSQIDAVWRTDLQYVISITDRGEAVFQHGYNGILRLNFDDIEQHTAGQTLFSVKDARAVLDWAKAVPEGATLVVHCYAGVSRSAAIAKFLHESLGYMLLLDKPCYGKFDKYNAHVYGLLRILNSDAHALRLMLQEEEDRLASLVKW